MHSPAHAGYVLHLNDVTWQSWWLETSLFLNMSVDLCSWSLLLRWKHNAICHLLQVLRLYESTLAFPPVVCLTGRRSSSDGPVMVDRMLFDSYWADDNLMTTDVCRKLHILTLGLNGFSLMFILNHNSSCWPVNPGSETLEGSLGGRVSCKMKDLILV